MPEVSGFKTIPEKILVPIDFSSSSHEALEQATALAEHFHAKLHLVNVIPESGRDADGVADAGEKEWGEAGGGCDEALGTHAGFGESEVEGVVAAGGEVGVDVD
jgi:nucleotide-binding universal stress UspA family protein